ncbi:hypothetical protein Tco_1250819 [Tanacetum coccineum]
MPPIITCAAASNPCFNVHGVELLIEDISTNLEFFDDSHANKEKNGSTTLWKESMFPVLSRMTMDVLSALDFEEENLTIEVQDNEATPLSNEEITLDVASQGTMASDSGGEEPDFDYDLTNYDIDY